MSTMTAESSNKTPTKDTQAKDTDVREEIQELRHAMELQAATQAGVDATQVATMTGAQATQAAAHAGTWSTMAAGAGGLIVGVFLALAFAATNRS
jgi:hypothetical protein